jgi:hypothetical protein
METEEKYKNSILKVPYRSPIETVKYIRPYIENKTVCELGCACGDLTIEMAQYAKHVMGIENDNDRINILKGLKSPPNVQFIYDDIFNMKIPQSEVYYCWIGVVENKLIVDKLTGRNATLMLNFGEKYSDRLSCYNKSRDISNETIKKLHQLIEFDFDNSENIMNKDWKHCLIGIIRLNELCE